MTETIPNFPPSSPKEADKFRISRKQTVAHAMTIGSQIPEINRSTPSADQVKRALEKMNKEKNR